MPVSRVRRELRRRQRSPESRRRDSRLKRRWRVKPADEAAKWIVGRVKCYFAEEKRVFVDEKWVFGEEKCFFADEKADASIGQVRCTDGEVRCSPM